MEKNCVSASIVTYNDGQKAKTACESILRHTKKYPLKLYVIDNASNCETKEMLRSIEGVHLIENDKNIGFGAAHNLVLKEGIGEYHFVINPDIEVDSDVISQMVDFLIENQDIEMAMPTIKNTDGTEQKLPKEIPTFKRLFLGRLAFLGGAFKKIRDEYTWANKSTEDVTDIDFCSGCFFGIKGETFKKLGGFDERFFMYLEDAELTRRAKQIGRVVINPKISVVHMWQRDSAKKIKYLMIHLVSCFKFLFMRGKKTV